MDKKLNKIDLDLKNYTVCLYFPGKEYPLKIHFNTSSRKFYFALIALVVNEMKKRQDTTFIRLRTNEYEKILLLFDKKLSEKSKSRNVGAMWDKIRQAWRNRLPDLEKGTLFRLEGRRKIRYMGVEVYECTENECVIWTNLIRYDSIGNKKWNYKFAVDTAGLKLDNVKMFYGKYEDEEAWTKFKTSIEGMPGYSVTDGIDESDKEEKDVSLNEQESRQDVCNEVAQIDLSQEQTYCPHPPTPFIHHGYALEKNFVGRINERRMLSEWYENGKESMLVLHAIGGMGKSALAWHWLHEDIINKAKYEGIVWWSFRYTSFESFINEVLKYVTKDEVKPKGNLCERIDSFYHIIRERRFLFVLDEVERSLQIYARADASYMDIDTPVDYNKNLRGFCDHQYEEFFQSMAARDMKSKILLISRFMPLELEELGACLDKELKGLELDDVHAFFYKQGLRHWTRLDVGRISRPYNYLPLSIRILTKVILKDPLEPGEFKPDPKRIIPKLTREGKPGRRHIIELAYNSLSSKQQELLSRNSSLRFVADIDAIFFVSQFKDKDSLRYSLDVIINEVELLKSYKKDNRIQYEMHPVIRAFCYERLSNKKETHELLKDYFANRILHEHPKIEEIRSLSDFDLLSELFNQALHSNGVGEALRVVSEIFEACDSLRQLKENASEWILLLLLNVLKGPVVSYENYQLLKGNKRSIKALRNWPNKIKEISRKYGLES